MAARGSYGARGAGGKFVPVERAIAARAAPLPAGWSVVARQMQSGAFLRWFEVDGAPVSVEEAQALVAVGTATTAQRREPDGSMVLLVRPIGGARR